MKKPIILLAESPIKSQGARTPQFAPTAHPPFETIAQAEEFGQNNFRSLKWAVVSPHGDGYNYHTPIQKPRQTLVEV